MVRSIGPNGYVLSFDVDIDGARLDEFTCNSGTSGFLRFHVPEQLDENTRVRMLQITRTRSCIPIWGVTVKYGKTKEREQEYQLIEKTGDYMHELMNCIRPFMDSSKPMHITAMLPLGTHGGEYEMVDVEVCR